MEWIRAGVCALLLVAAGLAGASEVSSRAGDPIEAPKARVANPTEVMVLATEHLSRIDGLQPRRGPLGSATPSRGSPRR